MKRVGGQWRATAPDRRGWRLVIENAVREKRGDERKDEVKMTVTMANLTLTTETTRGEQPSMTILQTLIISTDTFTVTFDPD